MMAIAPPDFYKGITTEMLMQPLPAPATQQMFEQINQARDEIFKITGVATNAIQSEPPKTSITATEIMARIHEQTRQVAHVPRIVESVYVTAPAEDWSKVRSPGRARRRRHKHRQNIRHWRKPSAVVLEGVLHVHPALMADIRRLVAGEIDARLFRAMRGLTR